VASGSLLGKHVSLHFKTSSNARSCLPFSLIHLADPHFGGVADLDQIEGVEALMPDLEPGLIVVTGDLTQRARHGEFQRARALVRELERSAPVHVIPGNHDVQWWRRPLVPFAREAIYGKYRGYFGRELTPTTDLPEVLVVSALTSYGVAWGSLTPRLRDIAVKGHLPAKEMRRAKERFAEARPEQVKVLVLHHNVMRGRLSQRMGLARWRRAQRRIVDSGAELVLCGHDHEEQIDVLEGRVVVSCANTLCTRARGDRPGSFHRVTLDDQMIQLEVFRWEFGARAFRRTDVVAFGRRTASQPRVHTTV